jgi:hypothetical protein
MIAVGRSCGSCSMCCRLLDVPEVKQRDKWCPHCRPGRGGCSIYETRPQTCRAYTCMWLLGLFGDEWFPAKSKIVVDFNIIEDEVCLRIHVDPTTPERWREEPFLSGIRKIAAELGHKAYVCIGTKTWLVVPNPMETPDGYQRDRTAHGNPRHA